MEKLIFPYVQIRTQSTLFQSNTYVKVLEEDAFTKLYPYGYQYLQTQRDILSKRDKGNREYETWYAYGRTQALTIYGYKLLFPYMADTPYFVLSDAKELLFYNGYAIVSHDWRSLKSIEIFFVLVLHRTY